MSGLALLNPICKLIRNVMQLNIMAMRKSEIYKMITDNDGSCRDVNFEGIKWSGVKSYIRKVAELYSDVRCQAWQPEEEANEVECGEILDSLRIPGAAAQIYAEDTIKIILQLQIVIFAEKDGQPFMELSFFPQDINLKPENIDAFINLIGNWSDILKAKKFFVRYENASWKFGDESKYTGLIYTSKTEIA